jgi:hypothetical protein
LPVETLLTGALLFGGAFWVGKTVMRLLGGTTPPLPQLELADPQSAAGIAAQAHWFGDASVAAPVAAPPLTVIGVLAGQASQAFAIVEENGQKLPLLVGKATPGGWTLQQVTASGVVLIRPGSDNSFVPLIARQGEAAAVPPVAPGGGAPPSANPAISAPAPTLPPDNVAPPPSH